jgi:hypothetical protein
MPGQPPGGAVPGLRYVADWLAPGERDALLALVDGAEWSARLRRRVQHYGRRYDYHPLAGPGGGQADAAAVAGS